MACKKRMDTIKKLKMWGCINNDTCVLCGDHNETTYIFQCDFAKCLWNVVLYKNGCSRSCRDWDEEVQAAIKENSGNSFEGKIRNMTFAANVYHMDGKELQNF